MKIAIIGSTGLLGSNLSNLYINYQVKLFSRTKDILINENNIQVILEKTFKEWRPDIVINAIGLVNLQLCEDNSSYTKKINICLPKEIALVSKKYNSYYIHISTDHFYNDNKEFHNEKDEIFLSNNYAKSKYEAEKKVLDTYSKSLVVRTNIIGFRNNNKHTFFEWILLSLKNEDNILLFYNYITSPISVNLLGDILLRCFNKKLYGVYNIASKDKISKYDFGFKVAKKFELNFLNVKKSLLIPTKNSLQRNLNNGLDVKKIEKALGINMPSIDDSINQLFNEYKKGSENDKF